MINFTIRQRPIAFHIVKINYFISDKLFDKARRTDAFSEFIILEILFHLF